MGAVEFALDGFQVFAPAVVAIGFPDALGLAEVDGEVVVPEVDAGAVLEVGFEDEPAVNGGGEGGEDRPVLLEAQEGGGIAPGGDIDAGEVVHCGGFAAAEAVHGAVPFEVVHDREVQENDVSQREGAKDAGDDALAQAHGPGGKPGDPGAQAVAVDADPFVEGVAQGTGGLQGEDGGEREKKG